MANENLCSFLLGCGLGASVVWVLWTRSLIPRRGGQYLPTKAEKALLDFRRAVRKADYNIVCTCSFVAGFYKRIEVEFPEIAKIDGPDDEAWMNRDKVQSKNNEVASKP